MSENCPLRAAASRCLAERPAGATGVVAVSGGPDSVALLRSLVLAGSPPLVVAHLNHQLRGQESDEDEAFVRELHGQLLAGGASLAGLKCERLNVRAAARGENLEDTARRLRYDWLLKVARECGAAWVATGHTAEDQAETVLHRIVRGTGLRGLVGIPRVRELAPGIVLVRPLLEVRRNAVLAFLQELNQPFRQDSSNQDRQYTRTRLRHELLPLIVEQFNPAVVEALCRLATHAGEAHAFIEAQAASVLANAELPRAGTMVVLDANRLAGEPAVLTREALRILWERERWPLGEMGFEAWERIMHIVSGTIAAVDLPGGIRARRVGNVVQLWRTVTSD